MDKLLLGLIVVCVLVLAARVHWAFLLALLFVADDFNPPRADVNARPDSLSIYPLIKEKLRTSLPGQAHSMFMYCALCKAHGKVFDLKNFTMYSSMNDDGVTTYVDFMQQLRPLFQTISVPVDNRFMTAFCDRLFEERLRLSTVLDLHMENNPFNFRYAGGKQSLEQQLEKNSSENKISELPIHQTTLGKTFNFTKGMIKKAALLPLSYGKTDTEKRKEEAKAKAEKIRKEAENNKKAKQYFVEMMLALYATDQKTMIQDLQKIPLISGNTRGRFWHLPQQNHTYVYFQRSIGNQISYEEFAARLDQACKQNQALLSIDRIDRVVQGGNVQQSKTRQMSDQIIQELTQKRGSRVSNADRKDAANIFANYKEMFLRYDHTVLNHTASAFIVCQEPNSRVEYYEECGSAPDVLEGIYKLKQTQGPTLQTGGEELIETGEKRKRVEEDVNNSIYNRNVTRPIKRFKSRMKEGAKNVLSELADHEPVSLL